MVLAVPADAQPVHEASLAFQIGDTVSGRYIIKQLIGRGGMGVVYRASDTLMNEDVALKFMKPEMLKTQKGRQRFVREAQVARRLRHENVVGVHDVNSTVDGILYISMEYIEGRSLRSFLGDHRKRRRLIGVRMAVTIVEQMLAALDYAHRTIVHRDIKPENIMLLSGERVKVLDFGLARAIEQEESPEDAAKRPKSIVGTLAYASPEQIRRQAPDLRSDLYSVGLIFRELLTLRSPVDEPIEIPELRTDVSPSILAVLYRAIERDLDRRWQNAGEFRRSLADAFEKSYHPVLVVESEGHAREPASTEGMVFLEGGSFLMGSNEAPEESPEFETHVDPFYMDITPVTVEAFAKFLKDTGAPEPMLWNHTELSGATQPVVGVSWHQAKAYAAWIGKQLPTETQWEFAARGKENRPYPWGTVKPETSRCNFRDYLGIPSIVTMHEDGMTPEGVKDMAGNVFEWTLDPFVPYGTPKEKAAEVPLRVVRGGSWHSSPQELRCTFRKGLFPEAQLTTVGFRCVLPARPEWKEAAPSSD